MKNITLIFIPTAELKTKKNDKDPMEFIAFVENEKRKADNLLVMNLMEKITCEKGIM